MAIDTTATRREPAGDALPPAVAELLSGLAAGGAERAAAVFAAEAIYACPAVEDDEVAPRATHRADEIRAALATDPLLGNYHLVRTCCVEGGDCLVEGWIDDRLGTPIRSFAASLQLDPSGQISRCLLFRVPVVEDAGAAGAPNEAGIDIRRALDEYFEDLQASRFEAATSNYSDDCLYSHPPYSPGATRVEFRGRAGLLAGFEGRGPRPARIFLDRSIQRGADLMLEGHAFSDGTPEGPQSSFVSSATVDAAGKVRRYVAFQCKGWEHRRDSGAGSS
jgi:hypothetical protein